MMITIYTGERVTVGAPAYYAQRDKAERIAAQQRQLGKGGHCRWADDYNDHSATGHFVVTGRA